MGLQVSRNYKLDFSGFLYSGQRHTLELQGLLIRISFNVGHKRLNHTSEKRGLEQAREVMRFSLPLCHCPTPFCDKRWRPPTESGEIQLKFSPFCKLRQSHSCQLFLTASQNLPEGKSNILFILAVFMVSFS